MTEYMKFLSNNNFIYFLQFGFRQNYSTVHVLISLTENIRKNLYEGKIGWDIFVDLEKSFDTVWHDTLFPKLEHYGKRGLPNEWLKSYLARKQYVSIIGYDSNLADVKFVVPQGSALYPLLFILYINDLNQVLKFCIVYHFSEDTNLLSFSKSFYRFNKYAHLHLKNLSYW